MKNYSKSSYLLGIIILPTLSLLLFFCKGWLSSWYATVSICLNIALFICIFFEKRSGGSNKWMALLPSLLRFTWFQSILFWFLVIELLCRAYLFFCVLVGFYLGVAVGCILTEPNDVLVCVSRILLFLLLIYYKLRREFVNDKVLHLEQSCTWATVFNKLDYAIFEAYTQNREVVKQVSWQAIPNKLQSKQQISFPFLVHKRSMHRRAGEVIRQWFITDPYAAMKATAIAISTTAGGGYVVYHDQQEQKRLNAAEGRLDAEQDRLHAEQAHRFRSEETRLKYEASHKSIELEQNSLSGWLQALKGKQDCESDKKCAPEARQQYEQLCEAFSRNYKLAGQASRDISESTPVKPVVNYSLSHIADWV